MTSANSWVIGLQFPLMPATLETSQPTALRRAEEAKQQQEKAQQQGPQQGRLQRWAAGQLDMSWFFSYLILW